MLLQAFYVSESTEAFDKVEMKRLFNIGLEMGESGDGWKTKPPGLEAGLSE